ncbi:hypothetical protein PAMP_004799 [Pampus punctatissimus]
MTAPCSPSIQSNSLICGTNSSSLSWMPVIDATGYIVNATATRGHTVSCSVSSATCTLTDLLCGETYKATVTARGNQCDSAPGSSTSITTAPCSPAIISKQYICGTNTAVISWTDPLGQLDFLAQVAGEGYVDRCQTTNTSCAFHSLPCGLDFSVTVQAQGAQCNSSESVSETLETVPCAPENVSATLVCFNHSALVSWVGSPSAVGYNVTATGQDGHTHHCRTNTTSCQLPDIHCGEIYGITVTPYSESCVGNPSAAYSFKAGLCPPSNVTVSLACKDSIVSWSHVTGAEMYIATATADDGHTHTCSSNYSSSCNFTDLHCGETYAVTVETMDRGCRSEPSSAVELRTALCPATNLTGQVSCDTSTLTLTWDQSPVPGTTYTLQTERIGGIFPQSVHTTPNTSHTMTNLLCGQRYAFHISAQDGTCRSSYSPPLEISTAPCQPTDFTARVDCGTNKGNFSWAESSGAGSYTVEVTGKHGHVTSCSSNDTSCTVKLHCGRSYSATLMASSESCNSTKHADIQFDSAPCKPENTTVEQNCSSNIMTVKWSQSSKIQNYTVKATSASGVNSTCGSTESSCSFLNLSCGQLYTFTVMGHTNVCMSEMSTPMEKHTAPCPPTNVSAIMNCTTHKALVSWSTAAAATAYSIQANSINGYSSSCSGMGTSCNLNSLVCGQEYFVVVEAMNTGCPGPASAPAMLTTAPCLPTDVEVEVDCNSDGAAVVSWNATYGAANFSLTAIVSGSLETLCTTQQNSCNVTDLSCGETYNLSLTASNKQCSLTAPTHANLTTRLCPPQRVAVDLQCGSHTAVLSWEDRSAVELYIARAVKASGGESLASL